MTGEPDPDALLMLRYARGDAAAFDALYEQQRGRLWRYLQTQLRDPVVVADVFQEAWSRVISHRGSYRPTARFTTWLYRIAHNCCVDHWRRDARRSRRETGEALMDITAFEDAKPGPQALTIAAEDSARLAAALAQLPEEQRTAFLMYVEGGLNVPEIADATGVGAETAKSRLRYAVAKLKEALAGAGPGNANE